MGLINLTQHTLERIIKNIRDRIQDVTPFVGTQNEWNVLSASEKAKYKIVHLLGSGTYKRDATTGNLDSIAGSGGSSQPMTGATASTDGVGGSTPTPLAGDQGKFLKGNAEWSIPNLASDITGTLPAANGGTGNTSLQATRNAMGLGNTTGALPVANGGTGQTTLALARNAMGLGNTTGALPVANGGTGATTAGNARSNLGLTNAYNDSVYSSSETLIGTLNGSNLYRRVIITPISQANTTVQIGTAFSAMKSINKFYLCFRNSQEVGIQYWSNDNTYLHGWINANGLNIAIGSSGPNRNNLIVTAVVEYTK